MYWIIYLGEHGAQAVRCKDVDEILAFLKACQKFRLFIFDIIPANANINNTFQDFNMFAK